MSYQSFSTDRSGLGCPFPRCTKDGLCREHIGLLPEAMVDELDFGRIRRYFQIRYRLAELVQGSGAPLHPHTSLRFAEGSSQGPSAPLSDAASRPHGEGSPASQVNGPSRTFTPEGGSPRPLTICMDCKAVIRDGDETEVSHGLCADCLPARMAEAEAS